MHGYEIRVVLYVLDCLGTSFRGLFRVKYVRDNRLKRCVYTKPEPLTTFTVIFTVSSSGDF